MRDLCLTPCKYPKLIPLFRRASALDACLRSMLKGATLMTARSLYPLRLLASIRATYSETNCIEVMFPLLRALKIGQSELDRTQRKGVRTCTNRTQLLSRDQDLLEIQLLKECRRQPIDKKEYPCQKFQVSHCNQALVCNSVQILSSLAFSSFLQVHALHGCL